MPRTVDAHGKTVADASVATGPRADNVPCPPSAHSTPAPSAGADWSLSDASSKAALARLRVVIVAALVMAVLLFPGVGAYLYRQAFIEAKQQLDGAAGIAREHALKLFDTNEMLLERMLDLLGDADDETLLARGPELHEKLKRMAARLPQIQGLFVSGADARMLASDRVYPPMRNIDYSDREMFSVHREQRGVLFVTEQLVSRATGEPFFDLSRRRERADGTFAGIVSSSLRPEYLQHFYQELAESVPGLRIGVVRADGAVLASWPPPPATDRLSPDGALVRRFAAGERSGSADGVSAADGSERLRVFRRLDPYPLYVVAAIDSDTVLAGWWSEVGLIALFAVPMALGFAWTAWLALRRTRAELAAIERLHEETAQRQRVEIALQRSQKFEAMGRLTGGVAHDFNNLLMIIGSNSHVQQRLHPDPAGSPQMAAIDRAVAAGAKVTRQLLAFSRRQALLPERIDLRTRLPMLLHLLPPLLGPSIRLESSVADDIAPIELDPAELELAIVNLAINAKDAMAVGGGRLTLDARNASGPVRGVGAGPFVVVAVSDTGCGIDPAVLERVFEPFFTTKPVGQGTGLGLSQVRALCQSAGGDARIESRVGEGTRVSLYFRSAEAAAPAAAIARRSVPAELGCRVLVVEDNDAVAQATCALLDSIGCTTARVANADAASDYVEAHGHELDVVLSDIEMPGGIDGIALAALLRARAPELPVLLMTGYAGRLEQAVRQHLDVLPKPCSVDVLAEAIANATARRRAPPPGAGADAARYGVLGGTARGSLSE